MVGSGWVWWKPGIVPLGWDVREATTGTKTMQVGAEEGRESSQKEGRGVGCGFRADERAGVHYSYSGTGLPPGVSPPCLSLIHDSFQLLPCHSASQISSSLLTCAGCWLFCLSRIPCSSTGFNEWAPLLSFRELGPLT